MVMTQVSVATHGPKSWLFYIVANVGPRGAYRPLAVSLVETTLEQTLRGPYLIRICAHIINILRDEANQLAIRGELRLAEEFYRSGHKPPRAEVPEPYAWPGILELEESGPERPWNRDLREFPFLSTCLLLGAGHEPTLPISYDVRTEPLGTTYRDDSLEYGMVAFDISDLDNPCYGIVAFTVDLMAEVNVEDDDVGYDPVEDSPPEDDPVPTVEENRPRVPLSAREYIAKFRYYDDGDAVQTLEHLSLIDTRVLDCKCRRLYIGHPSNFTDSIWCLQLYGQLMAWT